MTFSDRRDEQDNAQRPGPWGARAPETETADAGSGPVVGLSRRGRSNLFKAICFVLIVLGTLIQAFKDLSRPEAWAYWKELYVSPSMTSTVLTEADLGALGRRRSALVISGTIGAASASWFRDQLTDAHLVPGDVVLLSSPGGDLGQAVIMGEVVRARGLTTAVGTIDGSGKIKPAYCASACVLAYAGGVKRLGVEGSRLGVHRFVTRGSEKDPVAETQRTAGQVLGYMTKMGVSSAVVEAMSATSDIRWLGASEALAMNLITDPLRAP
jgi:hypothetical protein